MPVKKVGYYVSYYPMTLVGKKIEEKVANINTLLDLNEVYGVYSLLNNDILTSKYRYFHYCNDNILKFLNYNHINYDNINYFLTDYNVENHYKYINNLTYLLHNNESPDIDTDDLYLDIISDENNNDQLRIKSHFIDGFQEFINGIRSSKLSDEAQYGYNRHDTNQVTFILNPIRIKYNDEIQFVYLTLDIINFKFAILKTYHNMYEETDYLALKQLGDPRFEVIIEETIKLKTSIFEKKKFEHHYVLQNAKYQILEELVVEEYISKIFTKLKIEFLLDTTLDAYYFFKKFDINQDVEYQEKEDLYRIVNNPINHNTQFNKEEINVFFNQSFDLVNNKVWASSKGTIVSYVNEIFLNTEPLMDEQRFFSFESAIDMPLKTIILERLNNIRLYSSFFNKKIPVEATQKDYAQNEISLLNLKDSFYGSALNLIVYFKNTMKWYVNTESFETRNNNLRLLIENETINHEKRKSRMIEIITILLTIIFGFTTIKDILISFSLGFPKFFNLTEIELNRWSLLILFILIFIQTLFFLNITLNKMFNYFTNKFKKFWNTIRFRNKREFK